MDNVIRNPLQVFADHVFNPENIWNPEQYISGRTIHGTIEGFGEVSLRMQYCHGNSYCEGYIDNTAIRIFGSHLQGYQIWFFPLGVPFERAQENVRPVRIHPDDKDGFMSKFQENL